MNVEDFLSRLDKVKSTGRDTWAACCPAHDDSSPSFQIRLADDGKILLHCFAGCSVQDIAAAVGIELSDLFPDTKTHRYPPVHKSKQANVPTQDTFFIAICQADIKAGKPLSHEARQSYMQACRREASK